MRSQEQIYQELLVLKGQNGDSGALEKLVNYWQPRLLRHAWYLTHDSEVAKDTVQEAWVVAIKSLRKLEDPTRFRSWIYRIVTHKCADWIRGKKRERKLEKEVLQQTQNFTLESTENAELCKLRQAMDLLDRDCRVLLSLHYLEEMGIKEMAQILNIPRGTVKSRLYHARQKLKKEIERIYQ